MTLYLILIAASVVFVSALGFLMLQPEPESRPDGEPPPDPVDGSDADDEAPAPVAARSEEDADPWALDDDAEMTLVTVRLDLDDLEADDEDDPHDAVARAVPIVADDGAEDDEPTGLHPAILTSAAGQSDRGQRRKRNEDRFLQLDSHEVYVVADGMGGYAGGDVASETAVRTIGEAFERGVFRGKVEGALPARALELARAVHMANASIVSQARTNPLIKDMGTTLVAARFALRKDRVYIAHVGDSRCYRIRGSAIEQLTTDHTLGNLGVTGKEAAYLSRALGSKASVTIDVILVKPEFDDIYLLCSDGLTKMVTDDAQIGAIVAGADTLDDAVDQLIELANERGGKDNVTAVLVAVRRPASGADSAAPTPRNPEENQRRSQRRAVWVPVELTGSEHPRILAVTDDVSASGMRVVSPTPARVGEVVEVSLHPPNGEPRRARGRVVRLEANPDDPEGPFPHRIAVAFDETSEDLDSVLEELEARFSDPA